MTRRILFWLLFHCFGNVSSQQPVIICSDDWELREKYMGILENKFNQPYMAIGYYTFKEFLPDGEYIYLRISRKKLSKIKDYSNYIEERGVYVDSLRHGKFVRYTRKYGGRKSNSLETTDELNYFKGFLHGHVIHYFNSHRHCEGNYTHGVRDGFFYFYDWETGELQDTLLYINGELVAKSKEGEPTVLQALD